MSNFGTQHAKQEIEKPRERERAFSPWFLALALIVILLVLALFLYTPLKHALDQAETAAQAMELKQLELALAYYVEKIGEPPPNATLAEIELHVRNSKHRPDSATSNFDNFARDVTTVDNRETAVFWLGGEAWQSVSSTPNRDVYYEFPAARLTDVDNDGWPEYTDRDGNFFILRNGRVLLYNTSTQTEYSFDDLQNNGRIEHPTTENPLQNGG